MKENLQDSLQRKEYNGGADIQTIQEIITSLTQLNDDITETSNDVRTKLNKTNVLLKSSYNNTELERSAKLLNTAYTIITERKLSRYTKDITTQKTYYDIFIESNFYKNNIKKLKTIDDQYKNVLENIEKNLKNLGNMMDTVKSVLDAADTKIKGLATVSTAVGPVPLAPPPGTSKAPAAASTSRPPGAPATGPIPPRPGTSTTPAPRLTARVALPLETGMPIQPPPQVPPPPKPVVGQLPARAQSPAAAPSEPSTSAAASASPSRPPSVSAAARPSPPPPPQISFGRRVVPTVPRSPIPASSETFPSPAASEEKLKWQPQAATAAQKAAAETAAAATAAEATARQLKAVTGEAPPPPAAGEDEEEAAAAARARLPALPQDAANLAAVAAASAEEAERAKERLAEAAAASAAAAPPAAPPAAAAAPAGEEDAAADLEDEATDESAADDESTNPELSQSDIDVEEQVPQQQPQPPPAAPPQQPNILMRTLNRFNLFSRTDGQKEEAAAPPEGPPQEEPVEEPRENPLSKPIFNGVHMHVLKAIADETSKENETSKEKHKRIEEIKAAVLAAQSDKQRENENMNEAVKATVTIAQINQNIVKELLKEASNGTVTTTEELLAKTKAEEAAAAEALAKIKEEAAAQTQAVVAPVAGGAIEEDQYTPEKLNEMYEKIITMSKELLKNNDNFEKLKSNFTTYYDAVKIDLLNKDKLELNDKNEIKTIFNKYLVEQSPILKKNITENTNKIVSDITQNVNSVAEILKQFETQGIRWAKLERSSLIKDMEALIQTLNNNDKRMKYDIDYYTLQYKIKTGQIEAGEVQEQLTAVENKRIQAVGAEKDRADAEAARLRAEKDTLLARTTALQSQQQILKEQTDTLNNLQVQLKDKKDILRKLNELSNIIKESTDTTMYSVLKDYLNIFDDVPVLRSGRPQTRAGTITTSLLKDVIDIETTKTKITSHIEEIEADIKRLEQDIQRATDNYNNFVAQISKPLQGAAAPPAIIPAMVGGQNGEPPLQVAAITAPVAAPGAAAAQPSETLGEQVSEIPNEETRKKIIQSIDDSKLKLKALADKFVNIATKVKRSTNPTYATLFNQDGSLYAVLYQNYLDRIAKATDENIRQEKAAAARELVEGLRENNLIPGEVLKVSTTDKVVFIFATLFIRLIALSVIETLVEKGKITSSNIAIAGYIGLFTILLIALMLLVNLDMYRLRIVFNYINFHANSANFYLYLLMLWVFGGVILYVAYYLNKGLNIQSTNEETKLRLIYRIQVVSLIIWLFLSLLVFII